MKASAPDAPLPDQNALAASRVDFLTSTTPAPRAVRGAILESWRRSQQMLVAADKIEMSYEPDFRLDTPLSRSAEPVLQNLMRQLDGQSVSVILTDASGLVLTRLTGDRELERCLDRVQLAPGFNYAEKFVGTNGIGTALEMGGPAHVFGHEHYAEDLDTLACAGVPVHNPITGRIVGAIDLTCWRQDAGSLLLTLAKTTAVQIRQAILDESSAGELALFREYLKTCHRKAGIVIALNSEVVMVNEFARSVLDPTDQAALVSQAAEALRPGRRDATMSIDLPSGQTARMYSRAVDDGDRTGGVVVRVDLTSDHVRVPSPHRAPRIPLPGLVGASPRWLHVSEEVERIFRAGEWLALEGEPGVGKLALLQAVQLRRQPVGRFSLIDAADARTDPDWLATVRTALDDADSVVIRHVDLLDDALLRSLKSVLRSGPAAPRDCPVWVAVTLGPDDVRNDLLDLLRLFPSTVEVPPLRLHQEDLPLLAQFFLSRLSRGGNLVCSTEATRMLMRMSWPGNAEQVHAVLREVVRHRRTGSIQPEDLPPEAHAVSRRVLTSLESLERDAIVRCLRDADGNKAQAARSLGMSRATIYRKIHDYGIVTS